MTEAAARREKKVTERQKRVRWAYVVLSMLSVGLSVLTVLVVIQLVAINDHKFCQLITASLAGPAPKPADPKTDPSRARLYQNYIIVRDLGHSLGCL